MEDKEFIPVNTPFFNGNEKKYLNECIDSGWISSEGSYVKKFEDDVSNYIKRDYATACSNGSAALDIAIGALAGLGVKGYLLAAEFAVDYIEQKGNNNLGS